MLYECSFSYYSHHFKMGRGQLEKGDVMDLSPILIKQKLNQCVMTADGLFACVAFLQCGLITVLMTPVSQAQLLFHFFFYDF